jgi:hypothetical protein
MSDPRFTDPRTTDPRLSDPVLRQDEPTGGVWGWVAGVAVLALIAFIVVAGWNSDRPTASNNGSPPPITTGANTPGNPPMRNVAPPASTTGSGASSPSMPSAPSPSTPVPAESPNGGR